MDEPRKVDGGTCDWREPDTLLTRLNRGVGHVDGLSDIGEVESWANLPKHVIEARVVRFAQTIESEIFPRLRWAEEIARESRGATASPRAFRLDATAVADFTRVLLSQDGDAAARSVEALRARGARLETIYLDLLAPSARLLGVMWVEDRCSFADVTICVGRIQRMVHEMSAAAGDTPRVSATALLVCPPGEQHTLGLLIVQDLFRQAGWLVRGDQPESFGDLLSLVGKRRFDLVGISISSERGLEGLATTIQQIRKCSANPRTIVMIGGPVFADRPDCTRQFGADATAADAREALAVASRLCRLRVC